MDAAAIAALSDAALADQLDLAERGLRFTYGCDTNAMLGDERHFRRLVGLLRIERDRRAAAVAAQ